MKFRIPLESERLLLEPLGTSHYSDIYLNWLNDPEVNKYLESKECNEKMLSDYLEEIERKQILSWAILVKANEKQHIGNIKIDPINYTHKFAEYGILIGDKEAWGKGYAKEGSMRIIRYVFEEIIFLRKITLGVVEANRSALELYKKMDFEIEGVYKSHSFHDGKWNNVVRMALFNKKFFL